MSKEKQKQIVVSDLFKEIYLNFNVSVQIENMKSLDKRELYLFLTYALDKHSDEDPVVLHNFQPFKDEVMEIYDIQDDKEATNDILVISTSRLMILLTLKVISLENHYQKLKFVMQK